MRVSRLQNRIRRGLRVMLALVVLLALGTPPADAARLKDMASVKGVRSNQIIGYGLVVGLRGTGDKAGARFTTQSLRSLLSKMGIALDPNAIRVANVAAVMVTADLPPFARTGTEIDAVVSSIGDAQSLEGGMLLMTPLLGNDGEIYAIAQGGVAVGGFSVAGRGFAAVSQNHPTVGTLVGGAIVEREVAYSLVGRESRNSRSALHQPGFHDGAAGQSRRINEAFAEPGRGRRAIPGRWTSRFPTAYRPRRGRLSRSSRETRRWSTRSSAARIVLNERTGTIVMGEQRSGFDGGRGARESHGHREPDQSRSHSPPPFARRGETSRSPEHRDRGQSKSGVAAERSSRRR